MISFNIFISAMNIDSVKISASLIMMRYWPLFYKSATEIFNRTPTSEKSKEGSMYFLFDDLSYFVLNAGHSRPSDLLRRRGIDLCKITQLNLRKKFPMLIYPFQHCHLPTLGNCSSSLITEQQSLSPKRKLANSWSIFENYLMACLLLPHIIWGPVMLICV